MLSKQDLLELCMLLPSTRHEGKLLARSITSTTLQSAAKSVARHADYKEKAADCSTHKAKWGGPATPASAAAGGQLPAVPTPNNPAAEQTETQHSDCTQSPETQCV
jgi:hypothetical protein